MKLEFGYGTGIQTVDVPEKNLLSVLSVCSPLISKARANRRLAKKAAK